MDHHRAVGLDHEQAQRLGKHGVEPAGVGDLAAGDDEAHRAKTVPARPAGWWRAIFWCAIVSRVARLTRRRLLAGTVPALGASAVLLQGRDGARAQTAGAPHGGHEAATAADHGVAGHGGHADFRDGRTVDHAANGFDPHEILRDFDCGHDEPAARRARPARVGADRRPSKEIEVAPGVALRGLDLQRPHPRARRCARARASGCGSRFVNALRAPAHDPLPRHPPAGDGRRARASAPARSSPAARTVYEFDALPAGLHLYHCHVAPAGRAHRQGPLRRVHRRPRRRRAPDADEIVMVMNGFDTNFDRANELYAANTIPFAYMDTPIVVARDELVRRLPRQRPRVRPDQLVPPAREPLRLLPDRDVAQPTELTDTVMLCQGQRGILEWRFPHPGQVHVPRPPVRVHRARLAGLLRGLRVGREARLRRARRALMEAQRRRAPAGGLPAWLLGLIPLLLIVAAIGGVRRARRARARRAPRARRSRSSRSSAPC